MSKSYILYKDVAPLAEDDATPTVTGADAMSDPGKLPHGSDPGAVMTLETNQWVLDGTHGYLDESKVALWSSALSDGNCVLSPEPVIDIDFTEQHSSLGVTLEFDPPGINYCALLNIKWYQGETLLADKDFTPDSPLYFCRQTVTAYDRIQITLKQTSLPYRRAKVNHIIFGLYRQFGADDFRSVKIINQSDLISAELPVSTMDFELDSDDDIGFMFQLKQEIEARNGDYLVGVYYIDEHKRTSQRQYQLNCYDALGVLDESPFPGGVYNSISALSLLESIVGPEFVLDAAVEDMDLTGIIMPGSRRAAAQQVLFAAGWLCATDGGSVVRVFSTDQTLSIVGKGRTYTGASSSIAAITTEVQVTAHAYAEDANGSVEIGGKKYSDAQTVYTVKNPNVTANDKSSVVEVKDATLVSPSIGQAVAQRVYDYYQLRQTDSAKIVWKGERLGDYVQLPTAWGSDHAGHIQKMTITLSNTVAAELETLGALV